MEQFLDLKVNICLICFPDLKVNIYLILKLSSFTLKTIILTDVARPLQVRGTSASKTSWTYVHEGFGKGARHCSLP